MLLRMTIDCFVIVSREPFGAQTSASLSEKPRSTFYFFGGWREGRVGSCGRPRSHCHNIFVLWSCLRETCMKNWWYKQSFMVLSSLDMERSAMAATGITFQNTQNQPSPKLSGITFHSFIKTTNFPNSTSKNIVEITVDSNVSSSLQRYTHS